MDDTSKSKRVSQEGKSEEQAPGTRVRRPKAALDPISAGLKALWADVENEPVPDEFMALLDQMDAARASIDTPDEGSGT